MSQIYSRVDFFRKEEYSTVGLIRMLTAGVILMLLINDIPFPHDYYSDNGLISNHIDLRGPDYRFSLLDYSRKSLAS